MPETIVVPLDGSELGESALPIASAVGARTGAAIHLVHVRSMTPAEADTTDDDRARAYMQTARNRAAAAGANVTTALIPDEPPRLLLPTPAPHSIAEHLLEYAARNDAALIVMTSHGRGGISRMWFGSVADAILRISTLPILLVPRPQDNVAAPTFERVLLALEADDAALDIVRVALRVAGPFHPRFTLLRIVPPGYTVVGDHVPGTVVIPGFDPEREKAAAERQLAEHARAFDPAKVSLVVDFDPAPARAILRFAADHDTDLIVVGTHGRRGIDRALLGSIADKIVRGSESSVLVVPSRSP